MVVVEKQLEINQKTNKQANKQTKQANKWPKVWNGKKWVNIADLVLGDISLLA